MNKILVIAIMGLFLIGLTSALSINYYYSPSCGHCQKISPFIQEAVNNYKNVNWNLLDISKGSYAISGTPTLIINTDDKREIELIGSYEIPRYLECELREESNLNCETYPADSSRIGSWFVR